jgi:hypothetical protein
MRRTWPRPLLALVSFFLAFAASALLAGCGGGGGGGDGKTGVVMQRTGDPDDEVTPELDRLVYRALLLEEGDEPLPD